MKKQLFIFKVLIILIIMVQSLYGQNDSIKVISPVYLDGPRVGITYIFEGELADDLKTKFDAEPYLIQFGWQFESRYFTLQSGTSGLVEAVLLIGGLEKNLFLPSGNFLIGLRTNKGLEFGVGPNVSLEGVAFIFAGGITLSSEDINFPINLAVVPSTKGLRLSLLVGFNARRR